MYRPFKQLETAWNARTPEYLHPRTKANVIWQLKITAVMLVGFVVYDEVQYRLEKRRRNARHLKVVPNPE